MCYIIHNEMQNGRGANQLARGKLRNHPSAGHELCDEAQGGQKAVDPTPEVSLSKHPMASQGSAFAFNAAFFSFCWNVIQVTS